MHAPVLMLVTTFAASVAAAPLPVTPIESPVEGLAVRDAEAALSPAQFEVLKRAIFERLEEIVPVKRDPTASVDESQIEKRQGGLAQGSASANAKQEDRFYELLEKTDGKRDA